MASQRPDSNNLVVIPSEGGGGGHLMNGNHHLNVNSAGWQAFSGLSSTNDMNSAEDGVAVSNGSTAVMMGSSPANSMTPWSRVIGTKTPNSKPSSGMAKPPLSGDSMSSGSTLTNSSGGGSGAGNPPPGFGWSKDPGFGWSTNAKQQTPSTPGNSQQNVALSGLLCSCDDKDKHPVTARCNDCNEDLCDTCVVAHQRVKLTKEHVITRYQNNNAISSGGHGMGTTNQLVPNPTSLGKAQATAASAAEQPLMLLGGLHQSDVLRVYQDTVGKAKSECQNLLASCKNGSELIKEAMKNNNETKKKVEGRYTIVRSEIENNSLKQITAIKERERDLLSRLNMIRTVKLTALEEQATGLTKCQTSLRKASENLANATLQSREMELIKATNEAVDTIKEVQRAVGTLSSHEDDVIDYAAPDPNLIKTLGTAGFIGGSGYAPKSVANGEGLNKAVLGKEARFIIVLRDQLGENRTVGGDPVKVSITSPDLRPVRFSIFDGQNGTYKVIWKANVEGEHTVSITLKDCQIKGSPFKVHVRAGRDYNTIGKPLFEFGKEGETAGMLCRPWGVCVSREGFILVANRSNNRVEVYNKDGSFHHNFGEGGKGNGQFDRPSGVTCDRGNRVIVADKDNHRVQIFTVDGKWLLTFGEKGSKHGQFNYPWDVACNSRDNILVSDTRNHRIQLFSPNGDFLTKYGFEGREWKQFDSPRGVCFTESDQAVVTDFNNHRLLVVMADFSRAQYLGKEGPDDGQFIRPNGVAVDDEGNIIVADSRNERIQVFSSSGVFLKKFGTKGTGPGELDRPSGVCISPEGYIIVVDFGNNRVQVF